MKLDLQDLARDSRYLPSVLGFFAAILLLLFVDKLDPALSQWWIGALITYSIGAGMLSFVQTMLGVRSRTETTIAKGLPDRISDFAFWTLMVLQAIWLILLITYVSYRSII